MLFMISKVVRIEFSTCTCTLNECQGVCFFSPSACIIDSFANRRTLISRSPVLLPYWWPIIWPFGRFCLSNSLSRGTWQNLDLTDGSSRHFSCKILSYIFHCHSGRGSHPLQAPTPCQVDKPRLWSMLVQAVNFSYVMTHEQYHVWNRYMKLFQGGNN